MGSSNRVDRIGMGSCAALRTVSAAALMPVAALRIGATPVRAALRDALRELLGVSNAASERSSASSHRLQAEVKAYRTRLAESARLVAVVATRLRASPADVGLRRAYLQQVLKTLETGADLVSRLREHAVGQRLRVRRVKAAVERLGNTERSPVAEWVQRKLGALSANEAELGGRLEALHSIHRRLRQTAGALAEAVDLVVASAVTADLERDVSCLSVAGDELVALVAESARAVSLREDLEAHVLK